MRKIVIIILALVVALSALPITFACGGGWNWNWWWQPHKPVYCCPENCKLIFTEVSASDNEDTFTEPKDVGDTTACITYCGHKLTITINNAYPGYQGIVDFCVRNTGSMAATITGITTNISDPGYLQLDLTGIVPNETVICPCTTQCGQLVIGGLPQENTQNQHYTFDITIDYECTCVPGNCDTAYAYGGCCYAHCFLDDYLGYSFGNWGWTNGPLSPRRCHDYDYVFDIYAGAAQCDLWRGNRVGRLTVNYNGSEAFVKYNMYYGYKIDETHLYVGNEPWPRKNGNGEYTVALGHFTDSHDLNNASTDQYLIENLSGNIYIIAHAVVCR
jgi:hypothetical protein